MSPEFKIPQPINEPVLTYAPGTPERTKLTQALETLAKEKKEIPLMIGGREVHSTKKVKITMPHSHSEVIGEASYGGAKEIVQAVETANEAKPAWENLHWSERAKIFLKAADLLAGPYRAIMNAATMLGQSKSAYQAEIDSACELADFFRFNVYFYQQILQDQPISIPGVTNKMDYRPLEGFVLAITPFNFTAIGGNLPTAPALTGNTVVWKPSHAQLLSAHYTYKILEEAGLPRGVINFVPSEGALIGETLLPRTDLAGIHFTGSTGVFRTIFKTIGNQIERYRSYPRLVGETGGKDFVFVHPSADVDVVRTALTRGAFEYQGQKCSAASRAYIPKSLWPKLKTQLAEEVGSLKVGDVRDFKNFVNAVIDEKAFKKIMSYIEFASKSSDAKILVGGKGDSSKGYFIQPTIIETTQPRFKTMVEEIFGPVLTVYVYEDSKLEETLTLCDQSSEYALTGAVIGEDRAALEKMSQKLRYAAGNFYFNDKPTGAVVGQQPFGGARASGTNDKAGSAWNIMRWISPRTIKETFSPAKDYRYPFMG